jgi:hypothetical protein
MSQERPEPTAVLDQLDGLVRRAPAIPFTNQIRIDRIQIYDSLDLLRALQADATRERGDAAPSDSLAVLDELDALIHNARPVPLTMQVRVDRSEIYELLDRLRAGLA